MIVHISIYGIEGNFKRAYAHEQRCTDIVLTLY